MGFVKAKLKVESGPTIEVQFNPTEYSLTDSVNYSEKTVPGLDGPIQQFISGASSTLSMTLFFDTYEPPGLIISDEGGTDVTKLTKQIASLVEIKGSLHRPPKVTFSWGRIQFVGVITDVKQSFTMFLSSGMPVRAKLDITFKSVFDLALGKKKSPFESPDRTKYRTVIQGEYLWQYAAEEYGDPDQWRMIAKANGLLSPLDIRPGQVIKLPAIMKE